RRPRGNARAVPHSARRFARERHRSRPDVVRIAADRERARCTGLCRRQEESVCRDDTSAVAGRNRRMTAVTEPPTAATLKRRTWTGAQTLRSGHAIYWWV